MKFDEQKAQQIADKYDISDITLRVWKTRGAIPDMYLSEEYDDTPPAPLKHTLRAIEILDLPEINEKQFTSIQYRKIVDVKRHHLKGKRATTNFTEAEILALKSELTRLRNKVRAYTKTGMQKDLKPILKDARIKRYVLFADYKKMLDRLYHGYEATEEELEECRPLAMALYNKLKF